MSNFLISLNLKVSISCNWDISSQFSISLACFSTKVNMTPVITEMIKNNSPTNDAYPTSWCDKIGVIILFTIDPERLIVRSIPYARVKFCMKNHLAIETLYTTLKDSLEIPRRDLPINAIIYRTSIFDQNLKHEIVKIDWAKIIRGRYTFIVLITPNLSIKIPLNNGTIIPGYEIAEFRW